MRKFLRFIRVMLCLLLLASYIPLSNDPVAQAAPSTTMPTGWSNLNFSGNSGTTTYDNATGAFAINNTSSNGITNQDSTHEQFQFAYTTLTGDFTMIAKINFPLVNGAQAGILVRSNLNQGDPFIYSYLYGNGTKYQPYISPKSVGGIVQATNSGFGTQYDTAPDYMRVRKQWNTGANKTDVYFDIGTSDGTNITWTQVNGKSITDTNVTSSTAMYVGLAVGKAASATFDSVTVLNSYINSSTTALTSLTAALPTLLNTPTLSGTPGDNQVKLDWTSVTDATYYNVKRSTNGGASYTTITSSVTGLTYTDTTVTNGQTYNYVVRAANSTTESINSIPIQATPLASSTVAAPTNLTVWADNTQLNLSWNSVAGATSYNVKRSQIKGGTYATIASNVTSTSFNNTGLTNGAYYYYVVSAVNGVGEGTNSNEAEGRPGVFLINDNFENSTLGDVPNGYISIANAADVKINNVTVISNNNLTNKYYTPAEASPANNKSAAITGNSTNVLWINDNANASRRGGFTNTFTAVSGKNGVTAQLNFMQPATMIGDSYPLELVDSTGKTVLSFSVSSLISLIALDKSISITVNNWYNLKFVTDTGANTADVYINEKYQGNYKFSTIDTNISKIQSRTAGSSTGSMYLDNIKVYQQNVTTPQNLKGEGGNNKADLNWNAASGVNAYNIYRSSAKGGAFSLVASNVASNSFTDTGLTNDINYYYKVTAVGTNGESDFSNEATALPNNVQPPTIAPTGISADIRDSQITVKWDSVPGASYYTIQKSTTPNGPFVQLLQNGQQKLTGTSYLDTNLTVGTEYYYQVAAGNIGGVGPNSTIKAVPALPLGSPMLLSAEPGSSKVDLSWSPVTKATQYSVKRSTVNGGPYTAIAAKVDGTSYSDTTAVNGTSYYYVISAVNTAQESMISNQWKAKPYAPVSGAPNKPTGFKAIANDGSVSLSWNTVPGATSYSVKRATTSNGDGPYIPLPSATQTSYEDKSVANGTTYYYVVSAMNASGESPYTDEIIVLPAAVLTVDKNATANGISVFNTIQSAINSIQANNADRKIIYVTPGKYTEKLIINRPYVSLVGAGIDVTTIVYGDYAGTTATQGKPGNTGSTFLSQTVDVSGDYFTASNLTIENSAAPRSAVQQAVALSLKSDKAAFESVKLVGYQDTLYNGLNASNKGRHYFHNSIIQGDVDFIFGEAPTVVMDNVKMVLVSNVTGGTGAGGHITAGAQKNITDKGYVFLNSQVVDGSSALGTYDLGRPWKDYARARFINTFINSKNFLPGGWVAACAGTCITSYFSEYNSYGPGANSSARQIATQLTGPEASVTIPQIFTDWDPSIPVIMPKVNYLPSIVVTSSSFDKYIERQADIYVTVQNNGNALTNVTNGNNTLGTSDYTVIGNVVQLKKSYLAGLPAGATTLSFNFGSNTVALTVNVTDTSGSDVGKQVLAPNDGWASFTTGTKGGSATDPSKIYTVTKRSELIQALGGNNSTNASNSTPKIIYIKGTIDMNVDDNDNPVGMDYYKDPNYDFDAYLKAYDPAVWGKTSVPSGPLDTARAASESKQGDKVKINVGSNTTIVGLLGSDAKILGGNLMIQNVDNVIIRNIDFQNAFDYFPQWDPTDGDSGNWNSAFDNISVKGATHIWIDHNTFSDGSNPDDNNNKYFGRQYQQHDGLLDITNASDLVTVSYNFFHDHDKTTLIGGSDSFTGDSGKERVTFHHNYYKDVTQRAPRVRYGQVHVYNNYYQGTAANPSYPFSYTIGVGYSSQVYAENNYFSVDPGTEANKVVGVFTGGTTFTDKGSVVNGADVEIAKSLNLNPVGWTPTLYTSMDATKSVPSIVMAQAGIMDITPPVWTNGSLTASGVGQSQAILTWSGASDNIAVTGYKLYLVANNNYSEVAALGNVTNYNLTGLTAGAGYTYTIKALDAAGNLSDYGPAVTFYTEKRGGSNGTGGSGSTGGNGTGGSGNNAPSNSDGQSGSTKLDLNTDAKITKETTANGQAVTKVTVDGDKLEKAFSSSEITVVVLDIKGSDPVVKVELPASAILNAAAKQTNAVVQIKVEGASYSLPLSVLKNVTNDAVVTITITKASGTVSDDVKSSAQRLGVKELLSSPIDFKVEVNGSELTDFNGVYVDRTVSSNSEIDSAKSTAVWVNGNNNMNFVPSTISNQNGIAEITIHSPHNSLYTVIQSDKSFGDLLGHWSKTDVELLANKLIVNGVSDNAFAPERQITRAEFAAILVRSLGLVEVKADNQFKDVQTGDWFAGAVAAAQKAGLISGYEDGTFKPNASITREQMVTMIARALKVGGKEVKASSAALDKFKDGSTIAEWAKEAAAQSMSAGIIQGTTDTTFSAKDNATRAQSAAMLKRLLQYLQFIN